MTVDTVPTTTLLGSLTEALTSATTAFPSDEQSMLPPADGISLLDVKNDLLLSYLQNLTFLILLRLRSGGGGGGESNVDNRSLNDEVVQKLNELRVYVERGIRPLESRLQYQIDKVLRTAEETARLASQKSNPSKKPSKRPTKKGTAQDDSAASDPGSDSDNDENDAVDDDEDLEETLHRPNVSSLAQKLNQPAKPQSKSSTSRADSAGTGTYKPPRITPTAMPLPASTRDRDRADPLSHRRKSNLLNEYIDEELSTAPNAQPSIGSNNTILDRGRSGMSARDREKERERIEYEEKNFVRLPGVSKAEKRKTRLRGERERRDVFGGEDWTGLGGLGDRINRSVQLTKGRAGVAERREKRRRDTQDGQRGDGLGIGETFTKRQKVLEDRAERKRRKRG